MAINLQKGQRIDLRKSNGSTLMSFCCGCNWGGIEKKAFFGLSKTVEKVDLDLSCVMIDTSGNVSDHLYSPEYRPDILAKFGLPAGKLASRNNALKHSGDDRAGDSGGDDGLDNEVITVNLAAVEPNISQIFFFLNNVGPEDFSMIPYAKIRMYEGTPTSVKEVFASYNVAAEPQYAGKKGLILGKLYKKDNEWKFNAIGDPTDDQFLGQTIHRIVKSYL